MPTLTCPCGRTDSHVIVERRTSDGIRVCFWNDGAVTGVMGQSVLARPARTQYNVSLYTRANELVTQDVELYDWAEVKRLIDCARKAIVQKSLAPLDYMRRAFKGETFQRRGKGTIQRRQ